MIDGLRIVMDGAGDMPAEWLQECQVDVIPINIHFQERAYLQGVNLSNDDFYELAEAGREIPKTSQPTPQQFVDFYRQIARPGDTILSIHITGKLSGTFSSAVLAARELADEYHIIPFDSATGSVAMGLMCREARRLQRAGASLDAILDRLSFMSQENIIVLTLGTLEYARRSGRVKTLQAALASLLDVKPIIILRDGSLQMAERVRTRQRSLDTILQRVCQRVGDRLVDVAVVHARDLHAAERLLQPVRQALNCRDLILTELSIGIAANLGPGTLGIIACPVAEDGA